MKMYRADSSYVKIGQK